VLVNISASEDSLKLRETKHVMNTICAQTNEDAIIKFGAVYDETLGDAMRVTVVATGLNRPSDFTLGTRRSSISGARGQPQSVLRQTPMHTPVRQVSSQHESRSASVSRQSATPPGEES
jgi:cell division protein FtsZ